VLSFGDIDHDGLLERLGVRIDDQAFLNRLRKWLKAGILDTDGKIIHPETGTPQGGIVSPVLANGYLHHVLDLWFEKMVKPQIRGEALWWRFVMQRSQVVESHIAPVLLVLARRNVECSKG
jgi:retron-type reverse transcriptase